jgi:hypothetical protein
MAGGGRVEPRTARIAQRVRGILRVMTPLMERNVGDADGGSRLASGHRPRFGTRSIGSLLVMRLLLIANGVTLVAIGSLYLAYGSRPGGLLVGGGLIGASVLLFACVPLTDPYRRPRRR